MGAKKIYTTTVELTDEQLESLFISACEGGSNYWCEEVSTWTPRKGAEYPHYMGMLDGFTVKYHNDKRYVKVEVTPKKIQRALKLFPKLAAHQFGQLLEDNADADTGDQFLQLCCFGKVVYG